MYLLYNLVWLCCKLSICCGLVQLAVQHVVHHNKSKQVEFGAQPNKLYNKSNINSDSTTKSTAYDRSTTS